ncbi:MAG: hypothetical protein LH624_18505 [Cryobacterium sp.]|nr:hypothetical protein [Cryobacterium sp.]
MDSPGTSHNEPVGDLSDQIYAIFKRLKALDWGGLEEHWENYDNDTLIELRDEAIEAMHRFNDKLSDAMYN